jgi:AcrR family transcriptional regulator
VRWCVVSDHEHEPEGASARERLLSAALQTLFERGYRGATSREIARAARVNEVTLFRLFSTKDDLLAAALVERAETDRDLVAAPTGQLEADLEQLARTMLDAIREGGHVLIRLLPEVARLPAEQQKIVREALNGTQEAFAALFRHYQGLGELATDIGDRAWTVFVGPLLIAGLQADLQQEPLELDVPRHVQLFLHGCGVEQKP